MTLPCDPAIGASVVQVTAGAGVQVIETGLPGVRVIVPARHGDHRGFFSETWNRPRLAAAGIDLDFVQDNQSLSATRGTLRGLHFQSPPHAQDKLVRCGRGRLWDVAVDIRRGSPTFGRWHGEELSAANGRQLLVPKGFLHGFVTLEPDTEILYKCTDVYAPACDGAVRWDDPDLAIAWPAEAFPDGAPVLSAKDAAAPLMRDFASPFTWDPAEAEHSA
jgi:dTDP-4-dehydrorhamnose 3,5-epimerase